MYILAKTKSRIWLNLGLIRQKLVHFCQNPKKYRTICCSDFGLLSSNQNLYYGQNRNFTNTPKFYRYRNQHFCWALAQKLHLVVSRAICSLSQLCCYAKKNQRASSKSRRFIISFLHFILESWRKYTEVSVALNLHFYDFFPPIPVTFLQCSSTMFESSYRRKKMSRDLRDACAKKP